MSALLSYSNILNDIQNFRRAGGPHSSDFNLFDTPARKYFKILFYFGSESEFSDGSSSGLLAPTWEAFKVDEEEGAETAVEVKDDYYNYNSAWAFLKMNDENERAEKLEQFVTLLADINANSPWYFSKLGGITEAINRKTVEEGKVDVSEDRKLTIACLPDAFDNRIGTLLDLYRDITWSWVQKKEIIPANLRKFDMAVYIFETPEMNWHKGEKNILGMQTKDVILDSDNSAFKVSYKMIEFHDCEFNYNSAKSAWSDIDNTVGIAPTYTIEISYKDCYEVSYNDIMMRTIGDFILTDMPRTNDAYESYAQTDDPTQVNLIKRRSQPYKSSWLQNALEQLGSTAVHSVKNIVKRGILGNIYGLSLTDAISLGKNVLVGNVIQTAQQLGANAKNANKIKRGMSVKEWSRKNIYEGQKSTTYTKPSGNIFSSSTIANN